MVNIFKITVITIIIIIGCARENYNPRLPEYLRAERDLRQRVNEEDGLTDSIKVLQQRYKINLEKEFSRMQSHPKAWLKLLEELKIEK